MLGINGTENPLNDAVAKPRNEESMTWVMTRRSCSCQNRKITLVPALADKTASAVSSRTYKSTEFLRQYSVPLIPNTQDLRSHFLVQLNGAFQGQNSNTTILDARSAARFNGTAPEPRPGHMPGAINIPFTELLEAGKLKPASETNDPAHQRALACQKSDKTLTPKPSPIEPPRGYTSFTFRPRGPART